MLLCVHLFAGVCCMSLAGCGAVNWLIDWLISNWLCPSVCCLSSEKEIEISRLPKIAKNCCLYLTEVKGVSFLLFLLFIITIDNIDSTSSCSQSPFETGNLLHFEASWFEMSARKWSHLRIHALYRHDHHFGCDHCFTECVKHTKAITPKSCWVTVVKIPSQQSSWKHAQFELTLFVPQPSLRG